MRTNGRKQVPELLIIRPLSFPARLKAEELLRRAGNEDIRREKIPSKQRSSSTFPIHGNRENGIQPALLAS
jgi:hypothetical protein